MPPAKKAKFWFGSDVADKSERAVLRDAVDHRGSGDGTAGGAMTAALMDARLLHNTQQATANAKGCGILQSKGNPVIKGQARSDT